MYYPQLLATVCEHYSINMDIPIKEIPKASLDIILYGSGTEEVYFTEEEERRRSLVLGK